MCPVVFRSHILCRLSRFLWCTFHENITRTSSFSLFRWAAIHSSPSNISKQQVRNTNISKNFGLYRERTGAAIVIGKSSNDALNAKGKLLQLARASYTMPPDHGAALVKTILNDESLKLEWESELTEMRVRLLSLRERLCTSLRDYTQTNKFDFIKTTLL